MQVQRSFIGHSISITFGASLVYAKQRDYDRGGAFGLRRDHWSCSPRATPFYNYDVQFTLADILRRIWVQHLK